MYTYTYIYTLDRGNCHTHDVVANFQREARLIFLRRYMLHDSMVGSSLRVTKATIHSCHSWA